MKNNKYVYVCVKVYVKVELLGEITKFVGDYNRGVAPNVKQTCVGGRYILLNVCERR